MYSLIFFRNRNNYAGLQYIYYEIYFQLEDREREASRENTDRKVRGSDRPSSSRPSVQSSSTKRARLEGPGGGHTSTSNLDADEPLDDSEDSEDSDSDDDDTAALMAELQKIKREKAQEEQEKVIFFSSSANTVTKSIPLYFLAT